MKNKIILLSTLFFLINVNSVSSLEWHTTPDKWKEPRIFHEPFEPTFENRIKISHVALNKTAEERNKKKRIHRILRRLLNLMYCFSSLKSRKKLKLR